MEQIKFRIAEYEEPPLNRHGQANKNKFFLEIGTPFKEKVWWVFYRRAIRWEPIKEKNDANAEQLQFPTFNEAVTAIAELKKQLPKYHEIL